MAGRHPTPDPRGAMETRGVDGAAELALNATHQRGVAQRDSAGQLVVQRSPGGQGAEGTRRSNGQVLPHQQDFLLEHLPLTVLDAVELPLTLGQHLSVQGRLLRDTMEKSMLQL
ncbi:hypothetical protein F7725_019912 [Dissostichus mawsoni]|uniref:Uncharacterized protein n=1 Tax=Dissostichus mawsoni TaxID=36200 RepID=A0A7J5YM00_DISMA|nr:hypothetical protein F7725_019912 [Dissostichus mawsoni]